MPRQRTSTKNRRLPRTDPPYVRIAGEIRRRIMTGELAVGDRVPSTRQIVQEWGVAMATATKALTALRGDRLIEAVPRVGAIVARREPETRPRTARQDGEEDRDLSRERIAAAAIRIADDEGLPALSMRGVAAKLDVPTMSLYRHVSSKEDLVLVMTDAAFGEQELPRVPPSSPRARLEMAARLQWGIYRRHPWLAQVGTLTRPVALRHVIAHADWSLRALDGLGLDAETMLNVHITIYSYVRGIAINLEWERQAEADTGITEEQWEKAQVGALTTLAATGSFPTFAKVYADLSRGYDLDLDVIFEFGLAPMLDGLVRGVLRRKKK